MHNNSMSLFRLDGRPVLVKHSRYEGDRFVITVCDDSDPEWLQGVDGVSFSVHLVHADRLERAVAAFNAAMQGEMANLPPSEPL